MNTSDILNTAADILQQRGWTQANDTTPYYWHPDATSTSPVCVEGAMRLANNNRRSQPALDALSDYLGDRYPECYNEVSQRVIVFSWNDRRGRTAAEVVEVLRSCAVIEASRERETAAVS